MAAVPDNLGRVAWERGTESRDLIFSYDNTRNMSQLLCSRLMKKRCTKRIALKYLSIIYKFREDKELSRKWIIAVRRDIGKEFRVTDHTRVSWRHFKSTDNLTTLAGRWKNLMPTAEPSVLFGSKALRWRGSPRGNEVLLRKNSWRRIGNKYRKLERGKRKYQFHVRVAINGRITQKLPLLL